MKAALSAGAHRLLNAVGIEVRLVRNMVNAERLKRINREVDAWQVLAHRKFSCVLDIGANEGQFLRLARRLWPDAHVHSFEPLPEVFGVLAEVSASLGQSSVHNTGLGDKIESRAMHQSALSPSSSLLPMADLHRSEWPESAASRDVDIELTTLDLWAADHEPELRLPLLVKIDVQGFERAVIDGGSETIARADVVVVEVSYYPLYEGQALFAEVHDSLRALGFVHRGCIEQFASKDKRRVLFADAIFENVRLQGRIPSDE